MSEEVAPTVSQKKAAVDLADPAKNYVIRVHDHPGAVDAAQWNALLHAQPSAGPFMRHEYLLAMHESGSATSPTGWTPQFLCVEEDGVLTAACALYLKDHSYGEYVFDWAWADAYQRHGLRYYPKLLGAVPFTPVPGPRLMARDARGRAVLLQAIQQIASQAKLSSAHLLFMDEADRAAAEAAGWMLRTTVQFHWQQREGEPYTDFTDFLASMQREKRKKIQQERRKVTDAGVSFSCLEGAAISTPDWDYFYRCYSITYAEHRSTPYLSRDFFSRMASTMPENWLMVLAWKNGVRVASSMIAIDRHQGTAYGRYWGATEHIPCLHFAACYYEPLAWCIANKMRRFEGGAQGEHKMARGLLPVQTWSAHWLAHPQFAQAVADFLQHEGAGMENYLSELNDRLPFKAS